jgi:DNA-binding winged helix-turn-helix (wHTH) protein
MEMTGNGRVSYEFGGFVLDTEQGVLLHKAVPVRLAPKTLEVLAYMLERPSQVISKDDMTPRQTKQYGRIRLSRSQIS